MSTYIKIINFVIYLLNMLINYKLKLKKKKK